MNSAPLPMSFYSCNLHTSARAMNRLFAPWKRAHPVKFFVRSLYCFGFAALLVQIQACGDAHEAARDEQSVFVDSLLSVMSLEAKVGEMTQLTLGTILQKEGKRIIEPQHLDSALAEEALVEYEVGSILNCGDHAHTPGKWHEFIEGIQSYASKKRSRVPVLYGVDAIHGPTYTSGGALGPQQIGLAATWNESLVRKNAAATARQVAACGIPWNFSPVLDLGRDPRWPRFWETFGEDPFLASRLGVAMVEGYQNGDVKFAATLKHFFGYGFTLSGKDRTPAWIPERELREYFLPSFKAAIDAGAMSIMVNSGEINGIPVHANRYLLTDLLREELGFEGVVVSDWADVAYLYTRHMVAADYKEATRLAIEAGVDMGMVPDDFEFTESLLELVEEGTISEDRIDLSVRRILNMKWELGLFETGGNPAPLDSFPVKEQFEGPAARAALESITLLKNEGQHAVYPDQPLLPIGGTGEIFITGPTAHSLNALNGGWTGTWQGTDARFNTPDRPHFAEAMADQFGAERIVDVPLSMDFTESDIQNVIRSIRQKRPDCVVLGLGEMPYTEFVGNLEDLSLFENQKALVRSIHALGVPIVGVFIEGRPRTFADIEPLMDAIVMAYLPGDYGGQAIAQVLDGSYNPSGRLPFTWPRYPSSHMTYDYKYAERANPGDSTGGFNPQFSFGHGLSYSEVEYSDLRLDQVSYSEGDTITGSVSITNTGDRTVNELVLVYGQDRVASITPSVRRLRDFDRVFVGRGETVTYDLKVPVSALSFVHTDLVSRVERGAFTLHVGGLGVDFEIE